MRRIAAALLILVACGPASRTGNGDDDGTSPGTDAGTTPTGTPRQ